MIMKHAVEEVAFHQQQLIQILAQVLFEQSTEQMELLGYQEQKNAKILNQITAQEQVYIGKNGVVLEVLAIVMMLLLVIHC